jgi:hypothetical protein
VTKALIAPVGLVKKEFAPRDYVICTEYVRFLLDKVFSAKIIVITNCSRSSEFIGRYRGVFQAFHDSQMQVEERVLGERRDTEGRWHRRDEIIRKQVNTLEQSV